MLMKEGPESEWVRESNPAGSDGALALPDPSENLRTRTVTFTTNRTRLGWDECGVSDKSLEGDADERGPRERMG
jgi:hypothetical protein